jgi:hypothetical protein
LRETGGYELKDFIHELEEAGGPMLRVGWISLDNLRPFVFFLADCIGYNLLAGELTAIQHGVADSDAESGKWYDYELVASSMIKLSLGHDPGTNVVHYRIEAESSVSERISVAADIMAEYVLHGGRAGTQNERLA